jgi:sirohydrochlorin cobaltochelatase
LKNALILIAHGARDPDWALPLRRVYEAVKAQRPDQRVELAFLDFMHPDLHESAQSLLAEGFNEIVVVPLFLAQGGHLKKDIPEILDELRLHNPQVSFELTGPVGEAESVVQAMAAYVLSLTGE